jgi:hypothetical protein
MMVSGTLVLVRFIHHRGSIWFLLRKIGSIPVGFHGCLDEREAIIAEHLQNSSGFGEMQDVWNFHVRQSPANLPGPELTLALTV